MCSGVGKHVTRDVAIYAMIEDISYRSMQPIPLRGKLTSRCGRWQLFVDSFFYPNSVSRNVIFSPICMTKSTHTGFSSPRPPWAAQSIWRLGTSGAVDQGKGQRDGPSEDYLSKSQLGPRNLYVSCIEVTSASTLKVRPTEF